MCLYVLATYFNLCAPLRCCVCIEKNTLHSVVSYAITGVGLMLRNENSLMIACCTGSGYHLRNELATVIFVS